MKDIRVEYNVVLNNQKSIKVHIDYDLKGTAGEKYYITLWFKDSNGNFKYISGDAKSSDKGIGYYVGRYSYSSPGTYSIWFAPALHRLSLKPGERNFQAMAVVYDSNMKQLGAKTINVNLPDSQNYPKKTNVINTPTDKA
ncbi:MAG: hypothetical protein K2L28_04585, partial [Muribaculaceae bacterium]|nr:hypothetical protein [Muribaculaceae bacterium]